MLNNCEAYQCEWNGEGEHSHIGILPHLRRVVDLEGRIVDGKTGEILESSDDSKGK